VETTESEVLDPEEHHSRIEDIRNTAEESEVQSISEAAGKLELREGMTVEEAQERFADFGEECESLQL